MRTFSIGKEKPACSRFKSSVQTALLLPPNSRARPPMRTELGKLASNRSMSFKRIVLGISEFFRLDGKIPYGFARSVP